MPRYDREDLDQLLGSLSQTEGRWRTTPLTIFAALRGSKDSDEMMIIGRAVNGWVTRWTADDARDPEERKRILDRVFAATEGKDGKPMLWLTARWGVSEGYNTKRSAFWRVVRGIVGRLDIADVSTRSWPSTLCWSNLYKVAPFAGRNPSASLAKAQLERCVRILQTEVSEWKPRRIVFLTGHSWARPFLEGLGWKGQDVGSLRELEAIGSISMGSRVVVAPHPQGKREDRLIEDITEAFGATRQVNIDTVQKP